jgi:hypothetical protein
MAEAAVPAAGEAIRQAVQAELVRMVAAHAAAFTTTSQAITASRAAVGPSEATQIVRELCNCPTLDKVFDILKFLAI